jgi:hypothetical protein
VKIFAWLLFNNRLSTHTNLIYKNFISDGKCPRYGAPHEDVVHLFLTCPLAVRIWERLSFCLRSHDIQRLWEAPLHLGAPQGSWSFIHLAIMWKILDARNAMVFQASGPHSSLSVIQIIEDLDLWSHCLSNSRDKGDVFSWHAFLSSHANVPMCLVTIPVYSTLFE